MAATRIESRTELSFWWPNLLQSCKDFIQCCRECQLKARVSFRDRVPIKAIPRSDRVFDHFFIDIAGPFFPNDGQKPKYSYALTAVYSVMYDSLNEDLDSLKVHTCAIIHKSDDDFGEMLAVPDSIERTNNCVLPSEQIDHTTIDHLTVDQQAESLHLLDKYAECFADTPGYGDIVTHRIVVDDTFVPKRLRAYRVPFGMKCSGSSLGHTRYMSSCCMLYDINVKKL